MCIDGQSTFCGAQVFFKGLCGSLRVCSTNKNRIESIRGDRQAAGDVKEWAMMFLPTRAIMMEDSFMFLFF